MRKIDEEEDWRSSDEKENAAMLSNLFLKKLCKKVYKKKERKNERSIHAFTYRERERRKGVDFFL